MFSIYFGGDEGDQLGAVMSPNEIPVPVYLVMGQLQLDGLSGDDADLLLFMQEASNELVRMIDYIR